MKNIINETYLDNITGKMINNKNVFGAVLCVENEESTISCIGAGGNIKKDDTYFIASVTKLYVTAVVLMLRAEKRLSLEDKIYKYFPEKMISGIHILDGVDYTKEITIGHLISNTSGIPDYFFDKNPGTKASATDLLNGKDDYWPLEKTLEITRSIKPKFKPGQKGKTSYSDTNYQLLGAIIEKITRKRIGDVFFEYIFEPLKLTKTYAYNDINDRGPVPMYYNSKPVNLPKYTTSVTAEGGIVATAKDTMIFLKAFFNGYFFPKETLEDLKKWNFMLRPATMYYGIGLEKLWTPRLVSPIKPINEILGFWGQSGAFAFYHADSGLYFTGTANQINGLGHNAVYKAILKIIKRSESWCR